MIKVQNVTKKYGHRTAVENLNFSAEKGEVLGFLGPNGAGKTTTMKIITGCMAPTEGQVTIKGKDIMEEPLLVKQNIGYLPEIPPLYHDMYVEDYLIYTARLKKSDPKNIADLVEDVLEQTGLKEQRRRWISNLSKGYKQRTGLAQALVSKPEILILDEPTAGLDPGQVMEIRKLISRLKGKHTIVLSTHILSEVQAVCDRVLIIKEGRMIAQESLSSLKQKQMQGKRQLIIRLREKNRDLIESLKQLKGVQNVVYTQETELSLLAGEGSGDLLSEEAAKAVIASGAGLMELKESFSLESVFLELTKEEEKS